jgi:ribosomal protein S18
MRAQVVVKKATNADALRDADFRNVSFLHKFTSEAGNLPPRKVTKLQKKVHTHVMRQIKVGYTLICSMAQDWSLHCMALKLLSVDISFIL